MAITEDTMPEQMTIQEVVERCQAYWSATHVPSKALKEMKAELTSHLEEAAQAGKTPDAVIGTDLNKFAEEWARTFRRPMVVSDRPARKLAGASGRRTQTILSVIAILVIAAGILIFAPKENNVENEVLQWVFLVGALVLFVGEIVTAGFFLLPFAIGAAISAVLSFVGVPPAVNLLTFLVVSVIALIALQRYTDTDDDQPPVGANRYADKMGTVLVPVNRAKGTGRVRVETENWRASTDLADEIPEGTEVQIIEVRGTRLIVEPIDH
ncbi:MAG: NfeD family protein [Acidimicrobiia bacterium]|nr:NfeD family protein [Acidimicrobiia bacterium]